MRVLRDGRSWCGYCGFDPCRATARTADGGDLERHARYHQSRDDLQDPDSATVRTDPQERGTHE